MGRHYRSNTEGGPLGFLQAMYTSARWCNWVEPSEGATGEGKGVLFFRNRNGLGTPPQKLSAPTGKRSAMIVGADSDVETS
jgi:omega-6 fatty acid desaturase (delta-12 desaturase)